MADTLRSFAPLRPATPPQAKSSASRFFSDPRQQPLSMPTNPRPMSNVGPLSPVNQNGSFALDRVIKSGKVQRRVKKKGAWKSSWKPAYLVLRPNLLSVYKDADESELRASITLSDVTTVAPVKKSHHEHVFGIFSPAKNYHFAGLSAKEAADWIALIRIEARTEEQEDLQPPNAGFKHSEHPGYETTDFSADDDVEAPGSPEVPQWNVRRQKSRVAPQANVDLRRASGQPMYSGNESFATSQSDFSDGFSNSVSSHKGYLSTSVPLQPSPLTPIPDDAPSASHPTLTRVMSYISDAGAATPQALSKSAPKQAPIQQAPGESSRIVRQGHLKLSKTTSGVKQWKSIWMVLRVQSLALFKSSHDPTPFLTIPTGSLIEAAEVERKKQNCFQVIGEERTYRLQAETEDELESWLGAFKSVLVKQEAERERSTRHASAGQAQSQIQPGVARAPPSRDGAGALMNQMRNISLESQNHNGSKRVISPLSAHTDVSTVTT